MLTCLARLPTQGQSVGCERGELARCSGRSRALQTKGPIQTGAGRYWLDRGWSATAARLPGAPGTGADGAVVRQEPVDPLLARRRPPPAAALRACAIALRAPDQAW